MHKIPAAQIEALECPSVEEFVDRSFNLTKPLLLRGVVTQWPAHRLWNLSYFRSKIGAIPVTVCTSDDGVFRGDPEIGFAKMFQQIPFNKFAEFLLNPTANQTKMYLSQHSLELGAFSVFSGDVSAPTYIPRGIKVMANLWLGPQDLTTPLHYDGAHNLFAQISGRKKFILAAPSETEHLYPYPNGSKLAHFSKVDVENPDLAVYPNFAEAKIHQIDIEAGELLFLPIGWWHQVYSLTRSASVSFWWNQ